MNNTNNPDDLVRLSVDQDEHPKPTGALDPPGDEIIQVTVLLRSRFERDTPQKTQSTNDEIGWDDALEAHEDDRKAVSDYFKSLGLEIIPPVGKECTVRLRGTRDAFEAALNILFVQSPTTRHISFSGQLTAPPQLDALIRGVSGLCSRACVALEVPHFEDSPNKPYTPEQLRRRYNIPEQARGKGQTIAIIGLDGGFFQEDMEAFWNQHGMNPFPKVTVLGKNNPCPREDLIDWMNSWRLCDSGATFDGDVNPMCHWTYEITMNLQIASAMAPEAEFYFFNLGGETGRELDLLVRFLKEAKPDVLVGSFGFEELIPGEQEVTFESNDFARTFDHLLNAFGMTGGLTLFSSGNRGSNGGNDNLVVTFPASSPNVIAVGGERINPVEDTVFTNEVWQTLFADRKPMTVGGGVSRLFSEDPPWQLPFKKAYAQRAGFPLPPGRGIPDFSMLAKNALGPRAHVAGRTVSTGGTSLAAQLAAAMFACIRGEMRTRGLSCRNLHQLIYRDPALQTFTAAHKEAHNWVPTDLMAEGPFTSTPHDTWNPCVGLGSPNAGDLLQALIEMAPPASSRRLPPEEETTS